MRTYTSLALFSKLEKRISLLGFENCSDYSKGGRIRNTCGNTGYREDELDTGEGAPRREEDVLKRKVRTFSVKVRCS